MTDTTQQPAAPLTDEQIRAAVIDAITADALKPRAERVGLVEAMLAVVRPELARLRALVVDMHAAATGSTTGPLLGHLADMHGVRDALNAQLHRADTLNRLAREHRTEADQLRAAIDRTTARMREYEAAGSRGVHPSQVIGLLSPTWPDGNYEAPAPSADGC